PISPAQSGFDSRVELGRSSPGSANSPENLEGSARLNDAGQLARAVVAPQPGNFGNPSRISDRAAGRQSLLLACRPRPSQTALCLAVYSGNGGRVAVALPKRAGRHVRLLSAHSDDCDHSYVSENLGSSRVIAEAYRRSTQWSPRVASFDSNYGR